MAFWNRKKKKEIPTTPPPCRHHWKDFPWYWNGEWNGNVRLLQFSVYEPYVCIHCKERQDKELFRHNSHYKTKDEAQEWVDDFLNRYKEHFESRVIIEDMITDMQLVDREYLEIYASLKNNGVDKTPQLTI